MDRGFEGFPLFAADEDKEHLLARAARAFAETGTTCLAWAVMSNHVHFVLVPRDRPLGEAMQRLKTAIAVRRRRLRGERGPVFQGRFRSNVLAGCDEGALAAVLAYVLLNPLRAGIVPGLAALETYPWTSLPDTLGLRSPRLVVPADALSVAGPGGPSALRDLLRATADRDSGRGGAAPALEDADHTLPAALRPDVTMHVTARAAAEAALREGTCGASDDAVDRAVPAALLARPDARLDAWRRNVAERLGWTPEACAKVAALLTGADALPASPGTRPRRVSEARAVACALAVAAGFGASAAARATGISRQGAAAAAARGRGALVAKGLRPETLVTTWRPGVVPSSTD